jgi:spore maturation protein CgeB
MRCVFFYHSVISDWNHGNAHFLRGVATELMSRGHEVLIYEPSDSWSLSNLLREQGEIALRLFRRAYPMLKSIRYDPLTFNPDRVLAGADLVIVHEWNGHDLVARIGEHRRRGGSYRLLFHDTHHRSVTDRDSVARYDLSGFDGVLAYGSVIRDIYLKEGWAKAAWTWHEAADTRVFHPLPQVPEGDLVWIGNWGDEERTEELHEFLIEPVRRLKIRARVHGVRYPENALRLLASAGIEYGGWLPNFEVPKVFSRFRVTIHIPRRPYARALPGIPTIRPFEAMACGIPHITAPWDDTEGLFRPGTDYLVAEDGREMEERIRLLLEEKESGEAVAAEGLARIRERHTCAHRADELLAICADLGCDNGMGERQAAGGIEQ